MKKWEDERERMVRERWKRGRGRERKIWERKENRNNEEDQDQEMKINTKPNIQVASKGFTSPPSPNGFWTWLAIKMREIEMIDWLFSLKDQNKIKVRKWD